MITCCYCGKAIRAPLRLTREHIIPKSKGGSNHELNVVPCCHRCNNWKGGKSLQEFRSEVQTLIDKRQGKVPIFYVHDLEVMVGNIDFLQERIERHWESMTYKSEYKKSIKEVHYAYSSEMLALLEKCLQWMPEDGKFQPLKTDIFILLNKIRS